MPKPRHISAELWVVSITFHWLNCMSLYNHGETRKTENKPLVWDLHIHEKLLEWVILIIPEIGRRSFLRERERRCSLSNTLHGCLTGTPSWPSVGKSSLKRDQRLGGFALLSEDFWTTTRFVKYLKICQCSKHSWNEHSLFELSPYWAICVAIIKSVYKYLLLGVSWGEGI